MDVEYIYLSQFVHTHFKMNVEYLQILLWDRVGFPTLFCSFTLRKDDTI
jgi:hypothetical protein